MDEPKLKYFIAEHVHPSLEVFIVHLFNQLQIINLDRRKAVRTLNDETEQVHRKVNLL